MFHPATVCLFICLPVCLTVSRDLKKFLTKSDELFGAVVLILVLVLASLVLVLVLVGLVLVLVLAGPVLDKSYSLIQHATRILLY